MREKRPFRSWWRSVLLGTWVVACGPIPESEAPRELPVEEAAVDEEDSELASTRGSGGWCRVPTTPRTLALSGPAVAYGGGKYLVVWEDQREGRVYGSRMRKDGSLVDPVGFRINLSEQSGGTPSIAYDGDNFMIVWRSSDGIHGVRVRPDGTVLGPVFTVISSDEVFEPVGIACSRELCMVSYTVIGDDSIIGLTGVGTDGTVPEELDLFAVLGESASDSAVAWNGREFLVVWSDVRGGAETPDLYGARVRPDGTVLEPSGFPISTAPGAQYAADVTWTGRRFLTVWTDTRDGEADIYGARVRSDGRVDDEDGIPLATTSASELEPAVAHHNWKSLVVWRSAEPGAFSIRGTRVTEDGELLDSEGFEISPSGEDAALEPDVAYGGSRFLTVHGRASSSSERPYLVLGARVDHDTDVHEERTFTRLYEPPTPNLIENGGFEVGYDGPPEFWRTYSVGETLPGGWTVVEGNVDWHDGTSLGAAEGRRAIDLSGSTRGALAQTVPTVPGRTYLVTFERAGNPAVVCGVGVKNLTVSAGDETWFYTYDTRPFANDFTGLRWRPSALVFTATGPTTTLTFTSSTDSCAGPAIDNVAVRLLAPR